MNTGNKSVKALPIFLETLSIYQKVWGNDHLEVAFTRENIAICILNILEDRGSHPEATIDNCEAHQKEAHRVFLSFNAIKQSFPNIYQRISEYYRNIGNFQKALEWSDILVSSFKGTDLFEVTDEQDQKRNQCLVFIFHGKEQEARDLLKAEKYLPSFYSSLYQSISCYYKNDEQLKIGLESLIIGIEISPNDPIFFYDFAHCYSLMKNWSEAKEYYLKLLKVDPQDIDGLIGLGESKIRSGQKDYSDLDRALKLLNGDDPRVDRIHALKKEK